MAMQFDPPGHLTDLSAAGRAAWSQWISGRMDSACAGDPANNDGPRLQFFNPQLTPPDADAVEADISWTAFPRQVQIASASDLARWRRADSSRDRQDEYCEWSVERKNGKVSRVTFTCEGPEYWQFLAAVDPQKVLALYQQHVDAQVRMEDLFDTAGRYQARNMWNSTTMDGAMHLIQAANTLSAEIELAGGASIVRARADGTLLTGARDLIRCSRYGAIERHSDPHIGDVVNTHARAKSDITLANPIGLYFGGLDTAGWVRPDGGEPDQLWSYTRGTSGKHVRAVAEAPAGAAFLLGDVTVNGRPIEYGAQIADRIRIKLTGLVTRIGRSTVPPTQGCWGGTAAGAPVPMSVEAALLSHSAGRR
jgi:hypothetical protein